MTADMRTAAATLPPSVLTALLLAVDGAPPGAAAAARILKRVHARIDRDAAIITVRRDSGWQPFLPGAERKVVFDDGVTRSWLLRLAPGVRLPKHRHDDGPEECIVVDGDIWHEGERYGPGDYIVALQGSTHEETHTEHGALLFFRTPSAQRTANGRAGLSR